MATQKPMRRARLWFAALVVCSGWPPAAAADAAAAVAPLNDYQQTRWTQENGAPPQIGSMAQTTDGWLWLGTDDGLYRFDGMSFQRYAPPGQPAFKRRVMRLHAGANGDLYISYFPQEVAVLHRDGRFEPMPHGDPDWTNGVKAFVVDTDGSLWVAGDAIFHRVGGRWVTVERGPEWSENDLVGGLLDRDGRLWMSNRAGTWRLDRARGRFVKVDPRGGDLALAPDGAVWVLEAADGAMSGAFRLAASTSAAAAPPRGLAAESRTLGLIDGAGALWALNATSLACVVPGAADENGTVVPRRDAVACQGAADARADRQGHHMLEDREGNLWIATTNGLERLRPRRFVATGLEHGGDRYSLAVDGMHNAWAADRSDGSLWRLQAGRPALREPWEHVSVVSSRPDGALLIGGKRTIWRRTRAGLETIPLPPGPAGKPIDHFMLGILDDGKVLWTTTNETGLIGWVGGKWLPRSAFDLPHQIYLSGAAGPGQMWLATVSEGLVFYDGGTRTRYDAGPVGTVTGIFADAGADVAVAGENGFAVMQDKRLRRLHAADADALRNISGLAVTADGDRWLNGPAGVLHVRAADWRRAMAQPDAPLRYELFGVLDGYPGRANLHTRLHTAFSADGRHLWFLGTGGVTGLDSANLHRNPVAPDPLILELATDKARFAPPAAAGAALRLAPGSNNFRVQFTAPALRQPERVRFAYRLDGVDAQWQDAGMRRSTAYTNVGPGDYVFRVRAVNEDGVASRADAVLPLTVAPTLVQGTPFRIGCALALLLLATLLYRLRVQTLTRRVTERLTERLQVKTAERERIARTLHDTILQSVQALMLRLDALSTRLPATDTTRHALEHMLRDAGSAIGAGRDQVHELRAAEVPALEDIARAAAAEQQALYPHIGFELHGVGAARDLHAAVADEAGHIVREALRNAFAHAQARHIAVRIEHGRRALDVTVADDGRGLDADVAQAGYRSGHWGLIGMRERAARIGARLQIGTRPAGGTTVTLTVPAARAYAG